jgi:hypothetical protein
MRRWQSGSSVLFLSISLAACAHRTAGYGYGYGGTLDSGCGYEEDCYAGPQYTCVFYQPPAAPARLRIWIAQHDRAPRVVNPRDGVSGGTPNSGSSVSSDAASASLPVSVSRAPVITASPPAGGRTPQARN